MVDIKVKQLQVSYGIAEGDLKVKLKKAQELLDEGCRVKFEMRLKGRQNAHPDIGMQKMQQILEALRSPRLIVERQPTLDGKMIMMQLRCK